MTSACNPYDELPYRSCPIEWTAPERLATASLLHGGPRPPLDRYRVLELGCGNGANLLPLAYYRRHGSFVGVDGARSQIEAAKARQSALELKNLEFIHADFRTASQRVSGQFDYIIAHGVFSWVPQDARDALLEIIGQSLRPGGLIYINYNARPGWNVRGLVRDFLMAQTVEDSSLVARAERAVEVAARVVLALTGAEHHYSRLLADEFQFVCQGDVSWVGHEFLSEINQPYWRSEFMALARRHRLEYVADADFYSASGRIPEGLVPRLDFTQLAGPSIEDTVDLLCYRQLHSPILALQPFDRRPADLTEIGSLVVASCMEPCSHSDPGGHSIFKHPSGLEVDAKEEFMRDAFTKLRSVWPRGLPVATILPDVDQVSDDLRLLHRNGLIELRCIEPGDFGIDGHALNRLERDCGGYVTTPYHETYRSHPAGAEERGGSSES
jgi:SAM-dependent methyltransferase